MDNDNEIETESRLWSEVNRGAYGVDLSVPGTDPNLAWADGTAFIDFRRPADPPPQSIPVLVEMAPSASVANLTKELSNFEGCEVSGAYLMKETQFCTARLTPEFTSQFFASLHKASSIARFELQLPLIPGRPRPRPRTSSGSASESGCTREQSGKYLLLGTIDSGCPFAHNHLRNAGGKGTRVLNLWQQDDGGLGMQPAIGCVPPDFGYGFEVSRATLNQWMAAAEHDAAIDEDACYRLARLAGVTPVGPGRMSHGAAVLDLVAGPRSLGTRESADPDTPPSWQFDDDEASNADIACVQIPTDAVQDSSSAALSRHVLDGLRYIVSCASRHTKRIVVNISDGSSRGSHDGQSIIELAMAELVREQAKQGRKLFIVVPAGNSFDEERHAELIPRADVCGVNLRLPPDSEASAQVILQVPTTATNARVRVVLPDGSARSDWIGPGTSAAWPSRDAPRAAIIFPACREDGHSSVLITFAPTAFFDGREPAPSGGWRIELRSDSDSSDPVHAYIARNQINPGALLRGRQAVFFDSAFDPGRALREAEDDDANPTTPIRRRGTLNSLGTGPAGQGIVVVAGYRMREKDYCNFSSSGPATGREKGCRIGPDIAAVADTSRALAGIRTAGNSSGVVVRMRGTSFAAPQIARAVANIGDLPRGRPHAGPFRSMRTMNTGRRADAERSENGIAPLADDSKGNADLVLLAGEVPPEFRLQGSVVGIET